MRDVVVQERFDPPVSGATSIPVPQAGARIANSRGVPGTLGCIVRSLLDGRPLLLSNWHVLFGKGARKNDTVWLVEESCGVRRFVGIGNTLYGHIGAVHFGGEEHYVDCAVASCSNQELLDECFAPRKSTPQKREGLPALSREAAFQTSCLVKKTGAATGTTIGAIVDVNYSTTSGSGGGPCIRQQLLIRPAEGHPVFSAEGDSGALVTDRHNRAVGLLWGSTSRGEGIACHIAPVLHVLNLALNSLVCEQTTVYE